jgi:amino acid transporter
MKNTADATPPSVLKRELGLLQATAINMIDMVGIGPFIVLPLVIQFVGGPHFIYAWLAGACISIIDGFIWSELGSTYPQAGGSYNFLKEAYAGKSGRLMSFLYVWQTLIQAPLVAASGAIGFAQYFTYLVPLDVWQKKMLSGVVIIALTLLLYRKIDSIGKISVFLWTGVLLMFAWIITGALGYEHKIPFLTELSNFRFDLNSAFFAALGMASVKTIYSYLGYYNVCHLGGEIKNPGKIIPQSIFISIIGIAVLYLSLNISVVSVIPWQEAQHSEFIVSTYIEKIYGVQAANIATALILWIAFASLFAVMLGYSRVPYAAATDGQFFSIFAKLHPTKNFPYVSLLALGCTAFVFSLLFKLSQVISAILAMRIIIQFMGQAFGVVLLRKRLGTSLLPFKMPLYPIPVVLALAVWLWIFVSTGIQFATSGILIIVAGVVVFFIKEKINKKKLRK